MNGIEVGTMIYRNYDYSFAKRTPADKTRRFIVLDMQFVETRWDLLYILKMRMDKN